MFCLKLMACGKECRFSSSLPCLLAGETVGQYARHLASVGISGGGGLSRLCQQSRSRPPPCLSLNVHIIVFVLGCFFYQRGRTRDWGMGMCSSVLELDVPTWTSSCIWNFLFVQVHGSIGFHDLFHTFDALASFGTVPVLGKFYHETAGCRLISLSLSLFPRGSHLILP